MYLVVAGGSTNTITLPSMASTLGLPRDALSLAAL